MFSKRRDQSFNKIAVFLLMKDHIIIKLQTMKIFKAIFTIFFAIVIALLAIASFFMFQFIQGIILVILLIMLLPSIKRTLRNRWPFYQNRVHTLSIILLLVAYIIAGSFNKPTTIYRTDQHEKQLMALYDELLKGWPSDTESLYLNNRYGKIHVLVTGPDSAPPMLLFHATSMGAPSWMENIGVLNKKYRCYAIDHIGEGDRSRLANINQHPKTEEEQFQLYSDIADSLGIDHATLIGSSNGGRTAMIFASYAPERVDKLILCGPMGINMPSMGMYTRMVFSSMIPLKSIRSNVEEWALGNSPAITDRYGKWFDEIMLGTLPRSAAPMPLSAEQLAKIKAPTLLILGTNDNLAGDPGIVKELAQPIPNLQTEVLESSHLVAVERAEDVNQLISSFLFD